MLGVIGMFLRSADNAYQRQLKKDGLREARRCGFDLMIHSSHFDADEQVAQIRHAIAHAQATKLVAILVSGIGDADLVPLAHAAAAAGLEWAVLNDAAFVEEIRREHPERAIFTTAGDQTEIGRLQAEQVRALLVRASRVMCVTGNVRNIEADLRLQGLRQGLGAGADLVVVNADWTSEGARRAVEGWAEAIEDRREVPAAFVAQNDEMALGVRQALRDIGSRRGWPTDETPIIGCDGAQDFGQRLVREGRIKATVVMTPGSGPAIIWVARARSGGELPPTHVVLPVTSFPALVRLERP